MKILHPALEPVAVLKSIKCSKLAMDRAAQIGHLDVVKYLHRTGSKGITRKAMDWVGAQSMKRGVYGKSDILG